MTSSSSSGSSSSFPLPIAIPSSSSSEGPSSLLLLNHEQQQQQQTTTTTTTNTTTIDGCNLWSSWTRNYTSPLLAFWDLMDNAIDASDPKHGRIHIHANTYTTFNNNNNKDSGGGGGGGGGLVITNSCQRPVECITSILKAYNSTKKRRQEEDYNTSMNHNIGENGVGMKQGCATLSDLSFCLIKKHQTTTTTSSLLSLSLGVIAKRLQTPAGLYLPAYHFELEAQTVKLLQQQGNNASSHHRYSVVYADILATLSMIVEQDDDMAFVIQLYGGQNNNNNNNNNSLQHGLDRMTRHFCELVIDWADEPHVFSLVLDHLKHTSSSSLTSTSTRTTILSSAAAASSSTSSIASTTELPASQQKQASAVESFLHLIRQELPKQYIHIADSVCIDVGNTNNTNNRVEFNYWQRRLVELTQFRVMIDSQRLVSVEITCDPNKVIATQDTDDNTDDHHEYSLNLYLGFDPERLANPTERHTANMMCYSRQAGRLIKCYKDARGELNLDNGGTRFCQGMTIIVDDLHGRLPLNPTKQDFAFGERVNGEIHHQNILTWVGAIAKLYWTFHFETWGQRSMETLTNLVLSKLRNARRLQATVPKSIRSLSDSQFSAFSGVNWKVMQQKRKGHGDLVFLRPTRRDTLSVIPGRDTLLRFGTYNEEIPERRVKATSVKPKAAPAKAKAKTATVPTSTRVLSSNNKTAKPTTPTKSTPPAKKRKLDDIQSNKASERSIVATTKASTAAVTETAIANTRRLQEQEEHTEKERARGDFYKNKARIYREQRDEHAEKIARLSNTVAMLQRQVTRLQQKQVRKSEDDSLSSSSEDDAEIPTW